MKKKFYKIQVNGSINEETQRYAKSLLAQKGDCGIKSLLGIFTQVRVTKCKLTDKRSWWLNNKISELIEKGKSAEKYIRELNDKYSTYSFVTHNVCPTVGRGLLSKILTGDETDGKINWTAVGAGSIAATITQTTLADETFRKLTASTAYGSGVDANKSYITAFYTAGDFTGTVREIGLFIQASSTPDSGLMFSRFGKDDTVELPVDKSPTETLSVESTITITG